MEEDIRTTEWMTGTKRGTATVKRKPRSVEVSTSAGRLRWTADFADIGSRITKTVKTAPKPAKTTGKPKPPVAPVKMTAYRPQVSEAKEQDFLANLLSGIDSTTSSTIPSSPPSLSSSTRRKRKSSPDYAYTSGSGLGSEDTMAMASSDADGFGFEVEEKRMSFPPETRPPDSAKKQRLGRFKFEPKGEDTPRGVSFADDMMPDHIDDSMEVDDETEVKVKPEQMDEEDDFRPTNASSTVTRSNQSSAKDRLLAAMRKGGKKDANGPGTPTPAAKSRRNLVNSTSISVAKQAQLEAQARAQKEAEDLASSVNVEEKTPAAPPHGVKKENPGAAARRKNLMAMMNSLNSGEAEAEPMGTPFTEDQAATKQYIPRIKVDAFEPLLDENGEEIEVEEDYAHASKNRGKTKKQQEEEESKQPERTLRMYWLDYLETPNGVVHLIGKALDKITGKYISCCVSIHGIERNLFVLPRHQRQGMSIWLFPLTVKLIALVQTRTATKKGYLCQRSIANSIPSGGSTTSRASLASRRSCENTLSNCLRFLGERTSGTRSFTALIVSHSAH